MLEEGNSCTLSVGMQNSAVTLENIVEVLQKIKNRTTVWTCKSTSGYLSKRIETRTLKTYQHSNYWLAQHSEDSESRHSQ